MKFFKSNAYGSYDGSMKLRSLVDGVSHKILTLTEIDASLMRSRATSNHMALDSGVWWHVKKSLIDPAK